MKASMMVLQNINCLDPLTLLSDLATTLISLIILTIKTITLQKATLLLSINLIL